MDKHKRLGTILWLSILFDVFIVAALALKASRVGINGLAAWFRHVRLVAVSATNGQAIYQLTQDYRFTALYIALILGTFALTFFVARTYLRSRKVRKTPRTSYRYDAPHAPGA